MIIGCWCCYLRKFPPNLQRVHRCNQGITFLQLQRYCAILLLCDPQKLAVHMQRKFNLCRLTRQSIHISYTLLCNHRTILLAPFLHIKVADTCTNFWSLAFVMLPPNIPSEPAIEFTDAIKKQLACWSYRATVRSFASVSTRNMLHTRNENFMSNKPTLQSYLILASGMPCQFLVNLIKSTLVLKRLWISTFFSIQS